MKQKKPLFSPKRILTLLVLGGAVAFLTVRYRDSFVSSQRDARAAPVHMQVANMASSQGQFAVAAKESQRAVALDPQDHEAYRILGYASYRLKRWKESRAALEKAMQLKPDDAFATCFLGLTYAEHPSGAEDERKARELLDQAMRGGYKGAEPWYGLGLLALHQGRSEEAIENLEKAVRADPGWESGHYRLAEAYRVAGKNADAEREGRIFEQLKKTRPEFESLLSHVARNREDFKARLRLAQLCMESNRYREAMDQYNTLARRAPSPEVSKGLAKAAEALGLKEVAEQARADIKSAKQ